MKLAALMSCCFSLFAVLLSTVILDFSIAVDVSTEASRFFGDIDSEEDAEKQHPITTDRLVFQREAGPDIRRRSLRAVRIVVNTDSLNNWADGPTLPSTVPTMHSLRPSVQGAMRM